MKTITELTDLITNGVRSVTDEHQCITHFQSTFSNLSPLVKQVTPNLVSFKPVSVKFSICDISPMVWWGFFLAVGCVFFVCFCFVFYVGFLCFLLARFLDNGRQDGTYHGLCYTSRGVLAGTRNSSMGPLHEGSIRRPIAP